MNTWHPVNRLMTVVWHKEFLETSQLWMWGTSKVLLTIEAGRAMPDVAVGLAKLKGALELSWQTISDVLDASRSPLDCSWYFTRARSGRWLGSCVLGPSRSLECSASGSDLTDVTYQLKVKALARGQIRDMRQEPLPGL